MGSPGVVDVQPALAQHVDLEGDLPYSAISLSLQLDDFRPLIGPVLGWQVLTDALSDLPVEHDQLGVYRLRQAVA